MDGRSFRGSLGGQSQGGIQSSTLANAKQHAKEKEMAASVTNVYLHVVEDVIHNVRTDFQSEGVEDNVLNELQAVRNTPSLLM